MATGNFEDFGASMAGDAVKQGQVWHVTFFSSPPAISVLALGLPVHQVSSDRCRRRKIRCRGNTQQCEPCNKARVSCVQSAQLQRRRKRKSFYEAEDRASNSERVVGDVSRDSPQLALKETEGLVVPGSVVDTPSARGLTAGNTSSRIGDDNLQLGLSSTGTSKQIPVDPVIGHMGRLVSDDRGVSIFAGSTTGVHFASQVEQTIQVRNMSQAAFPNCVYSLYTHDVWRHATFSPHDEHIVRTILAQIPSNAEDIIAAAVKDWTPLYPIVHGPTVQSYLKQVKDGQLQHDSQPLTTLYLILGVLALGSLGLQGYCTRDHSHFLCLSEVYYDLSTKIHQRVLQHPCLVTLQGLQVIQIYLQLSTRKGTALEMSGTATRLAQSLGLHRNSQRFRFNPLDTEVRRRVWWCQYALDVFSSAYHGLPRLVRDQDVDTDFPTSIDDRQLSLTHMEFPLPGQGSQVDTAISMFHITRIIGSTLENLYTTTRRREGVAKIKRLQAELDVWSTRPHIGFTAAVPFLAEVKLLSDSDSDLSGQPFGILWLHVVLAIATIHIHRPALSFTAPCAQIAVSLGMCVRASISLIRIVADGVLGTAEPTDIEVSNSSMLLLFLYPNGPHMLWQAALTILYAHWKSQARPPPTRDGFGDEGGLERTAQDEVIDFAIVRRCATLLRRISHLTTDRVLPKATFAAYPLIECAKLLDHLGTKTFSQRDHFSVSMSGTTVDDLRVNHDDGPSEEVNSSWTQGGEIWNHGPAADVENWPIESALDLINAMEMEPYDLFTLSADFLQ